MKKPITIFVVSGGVGASGEQVVHTVLAQFPNNQVRVTTIPNVRLESQIDEAVSQARAADGLLVHTLVDESLRQRLVSLASELNTPTIDLMGPLIEYLTQATGNPPLGKPGLYRKLNQNYFDRVSAIEFTMAHDDGQRPEDWSEAEIILTGVSRVGKTPLSLYLSVLGWKVANIPFVLGLELHPEIRRLDPRRVFGLTVEAGQLLAFRKQRQQRLGVGGISEYTNPQKIYDELQAAVDFFQSAGYTIIDVTDKPIESSADEVLRRVQSLDRW